MQELVPEIIVKEVTTIETLQPDVLKQLIVKNVLLSRLELRLKTKGIAVVDANNLDFSDPDISRHAKDVLREHIYREKKERLSTKE